MTIREKYLRVPPEKWKRYQTKERTTGWKPPWFKMWASILDDHVLRLLAPEERWVYVGILCLANESDNRVDSSAKSLAFRLTTAEEVVKRAVRTLIANGLIEPCPARLVDKVSKSDRNDCQSEVHPKVEVEEEERTGSSPSIVVRAEGNGLLDSHKQKHLNAILALCSDADAGSAGVLVSAARGLPEGSLVRVLESCRLFPGRVGVGYAVNALKSEREEREAA